MSTEVNLHGDTGTRNIHSLLPIPALSKYLIGRPQSVDLVDLDSSTVIHTFHTEMMQPRTLKQISLTPAQQPGLASLTLAYTSAESGDLVVDTYLPDIDTDIIPPFSPAESGSHNPWSQTRKVTKHITNPGVWEALPSGSIIGVHKKQATPSPQTTTTTTTPTTTTITTPSSLTALRRRTVGRSNSDISQHSNTPPPTTTTTHPQFQSWKWEWEAWVLNLRPDAKSAFETRPLNNDNNDSNTDTSSQQQHHQQHLMISDLGPMTRLGTMSVAVGLGDVVKVVSAGHEYFDQGRAGSLVSGERLQVQQVMGVGGRRKKGSAAGSVRGGAGGGGRRESANVGVSGSAG